MSIKESITSKLKTVSENVPKVYEAGKAAGKKEGEQAEYDRFWDAYQPNGGAKLYFYAFAGYGWTDETFKPKCNIVMLGGSNLCAFQYCRVTDLVKSLEDCGVTLDTSAALNLSGAFAYAETKTLPVISIVNAESVNSVFQDCKKLESIERLVVSQNNKFSANVFSGCEKLRDVVFDGVVANDIDMHWSPLSKESIESVVGCLDVKKDENGDYITKGKTLTLSKTAVENYFSMATNILGSPFDGGTHAENGVTFSDNEDGTITAQGTATGDAFYTLKSNLSIPKGTYTIHKPTNGVIFVTLSDGREFDYQTPTFVVDEDGITANIILAYYGEGTTTITPKIMMEGEWDAIAATKPNWTISLA